MDNDSMYIGIFFGSIFYLLIWAVILNAIIANASRSKKIELELQKQTNLLAKIACAHGVPENEIHEIINTKPMTSDEKLISVSKK